DEINLYDYWKVIVKRKRLIIGLFLVSVLAATVISLLMPKIYRGEVILKLPSITAKEMVAIIGKIDAEKFLPTTHHLVSDVKLNTLKDSTDKLRLIIEAKNTDAIPSAMTDFVGYLNNFSLINRAIKEERERLIKQSEELSIVIEQSNKLAETYEKLLKAGKYVPIGFSLAGFYPADIRKKISDWEVEKFTIDQTLQRPKGVEMLEKPYILKNPVKPSIKKNIALAGIASLFAGIFLAFLLE
ncbi:MAG: Wzz/FepE/Etk N-terminal domain-containing protein, partial [Nitrospirota bacterium]|nr:Wzz/FepE/Etk N-terminal domain-containing protein [Nitrospirota bacterium]